MCHYLLPFFFLSICLAGAAQNSSSVTKSIHDDGKTLKLKYEAITNGRVINYENEFAVSGWSKQQKDDLINTVIDSLQSAKPGQRNYINKQIDDNGETLTVSIDALQNGRKVSYKNSFNVKGKDQKQKEAIIKEVMTSLNLSEEEKR